MHSHTTDTNVYTYMYMYIKKVHIHMHMYMYMQVYTIYMSYKHLFTKNRQDHTPEIKHPTLDLILEWLIERRMPRLISNIAKTISF